MLDGVAKEPAFGLEPAQDRTPVTLITSITGTKPNSRLTGNTGGEHLPWQQLPPDVDPESTESSAGGDGPGRYSGEKDREVEPEDDRSDGLEHGPVQEETLDPEEKSADMDLEL